jgi:hypothetical protein
MRKVTATVLLLMALVLPVLLFWQLSSHSSLSGLVAGAIAVAAGWTLNMAWAFATQEAPAGDALQAGTGNLKIAAAFGWVCPTVLAGLTWLVVRFLA